MNEILPAKNENKSMIIWSSIQKLRVDRFRNKLRVLIYVYSEERKKETYAKTTYMYIPFLDFNDIETGPFPAWKIYENDIFLSFLDFNDI